MPTVATIEAPRATETTEDHMLLDQPDRSAWHLIARGLVTESVQPLGFAETIQS